MSTLPRPCLTPESYLAIERRSELKHEYYAGEMFAMTGASEEHNLIAGNIFAGLHQQFRRRGCKVFLSDMRVKVSDTGLYTYPDVVAVCGAAEFEDAEVDTLMNLTFVVEVLSESTEAYDRGKKFEHYRQIASLQEYLMVAQDRCHVERYRRSDDGTWPMTERTGLDATLDLPSIGATLSLADVYEKVEFAS